MAISALSGTAQNKGLTLILSASIYATAMAYEADYFFLSSLNINTFNILIPVHLHHNVSSLLLVRFLWAAKMSLFLMLTGIFV
jgi:hypothetical protein